MEETEALLLAVESRIEHYHQQDSTQQFPSQIQANFVQLVAMVIQLVAEVSNLVVEVIQVMVVVDPTMALLSLLISSMVSGLSVNYATNLVTRFRSAIIASIHTFSL